MTCSAIPVPVSGLSEVTAIATGYGQSLALLANETVMGWGEDFSGQVGSGTAVPRHNDVPVAVSGLTSGVTSIAGGDVFSMAELHGETGQIAGKVTSVSGGTSLEGVSVCAYTHSGAFHGRCSQTKANGEYAISGLAGGEYTIEFSPPSKSTLNYTPQYYEGKSSLAEAKLVPVTVAETTPGIDAELELGGQISGEVKSAKGAKKLAGIEVCASEAGGGDFGERCALTNSSGEYTIAGLVSGKYDVEFSASNKSTSNYITQYYRGVYSMSEATAVTVAAEGLTLGVDAELEERVHLTGQGIAGQVTDASTKNEIKGIEVCAYEASGEVLEGILGDCAKTNALGEYAISGLPSGEYIVEFLSPSGSGLNYVTQYYKDSTTIDDAIPVSVNASSADTGIGAQLEEGGRIAGTVTDASTSTAIGGVEVCAFSTSSESLGCALTDAQGGYTISGLGDGDYDVGFLSPPSLDYVTQYYEGQRKASAANPVQVAEGSTTLNIDAQLGLGGRIEGKIADGSTNAAMKEVIVCALQSVTESVGCALTDASGEYTIAGLPAGKYEVGFDAGKGYVIQYYDDKFTFPEAQAVTVTTGGTHGPHRCRDGNERFGAAGQHQGSGDLRDPGCRGNTIVCNRFVDRHSDANTHRAVATRWRSDRRRNRQPLSGAGRRRRIKPRLSGHGEEHRGRKERHERRARHPGKPDRTNRYAESGCYFLNAEHDQSHILAASPRHDRGVGDRRVREFGVGASDVQPRDVSGV